MKKKKLNILFLALTSITFLGGCSASGDYPGVEYAPQMYHSVAYEPLSLIASEGDGVPTGPLASYYYRQYANPLPVNEFGNSVKSPINTLTPVEGTVKRQEYATIDTVLFYTLHKDSLSLASTLLKNPLPQTEQVLKEGKHLYLGFCAPCHGAKGDGQGAVGVVYGGVPNYTARAYSSLTEGHIFHVISHGKGRMWAHKSQINPEERWKIVRYVQQLQQGKP